MNNNFTTLNIDPANKQTAYVLINKDGVIYDKGIVPNDEFLHLAETLDYDVMNIEIVANMGVSGVSLYDTSEMVGILCYIAIRRNKVLNRYKRHEVKKVFGTWRKPPSIDSQIRTKLISKYGEVGTVKNKGYFFGFKADLWSAMAIYHTYKSKGETTGSYLFNDSN